MTKVWLFLGVFLPSLTAFSYPEFIGLGYTGCVTCHYNGAGNGALNDYGRGLFAAEIAAKTLWNSEKTDEELSAESGFLGATELPNGIRPSIKYRALQLIDNPRSADQRQPKIYQMQQDFNLHWLLDEEAKIVIALNLGRVPSVQAAQPNTTLAGSQWLSREYYGRIQTSEQWWIYVGFLDKVYGIRHPDHTAFNRGPLGLGQNDQVHGVVAHYADEQQEFFVQPFLGNLHQDKNHQYPGLAARYEYEPAEKLRVGVSFLRDADASSRDKNVFGLLLKRGITGGHSVLFETGFKNANPRSGSQLASVYAWTQASFRATRGYFLQTIMEYFKNDTSKLGPENMGLGLGLLAFPVQRFEFRFFGMSKRVIDPTTVSSDHWSLQSQLHLSF